jgi:hypothetical protein
MDNNELNKLMDCPFCGRKVKIKKRYVKDWKGEITQRFYRIACSCGAGTYKEYKTEKAVTNVWNRRV